MSISLVFISPGLFLSDIFYIFAMIPKEGIDLQWFWGAEIQIPHICNVFFVNLMIQYFKCSVLYMLQYLIGIPIV